MEDGGQFGVGKSERIPLTGVGSSWYGERQGRQREGGMETQRAPFSFSLLPPFERRSADPAPSGVFQ